MDAEKESDPAWSPAGDVIAYSASLEVPKPDGSVEVVLPSSMFVKLVRGGVSRLTMPDPAAVEWSRDAGDDQPPWSPDGKTIAFGRGFSGPTPLARTTRLYTVPAVWNSCCSAPTLLGEGGAYVAGLDWSPDGASIVWSEERYPVPWAAMRRLDVVTGVSVGIGIPLGFSHYTMPALSSDGASLAFSAHTVNQVMADGYVWDASGAEGPRRVTSDPAWDTDPAWQPWFHPIGMVDRPDEQRFYIINELGRDAGGLGPADYSFVFGNPGDHPVVGDWDSDGIDEVGLYRETTGLFYWRNTPATGFADGSIHFGNPGDMFVAGDWDGSATDTPAVFRPGSQTIYFRSSLTEGVADSQLHCKNSGCSSTFSTPVAGDFGLAN